MRQEIIFNLVLFSPFYVTYLAFIDRNAYYCLIGFASGIGTPGGGGGLRMRGLCGCIHVCGCVSCVRFV